MSGSKGSVPISFSSSSERPSLSSSVSPLFPIPSPSVSIVSSGSVGNSSGPPIQICESFIVTLTEPSQTPSPSVSGLVELVTGSDEASVVSSRPSLSSSVSALLPVPSPSVSNHSFSFSGNTSPAMQDSAVPEPSQ